MEWSPGEQLAHYRLDGRIGTGGMGEVWKAVDTALHREVALKMLPAHLASDPERLQRFRQEARILASLNHPHIATIYGLHESGETPFLAMELVAGQDLSRCLAAGPLPAGRARGILTQVAEALVAAHQRGVIHRDLKPANILVSPGDRVKVIDFGLAKAAGSASPLDDTSAPTRTSGPSRAGIVMGTAAYMSPEQARGQRVGPGTDIWAFGCILFECLAGARPFQGATGSDLLASILKDDPAWSLLPPTLPASLSSLMRACLSKDPDDRPPSAAATLSFLSGASSDHTPVGAQSTGRSVAVLPFANMSADPENEYFSDGITEEIISALTRVEGLRVAARSSCFSFKGKNADVTEVGAKLKVGTVLDGSVRKAGNRVRITARLTNVSDGFQLWSETFDRDLTDVFQIQDETAAAIARKLGDAGAQPAPHPAAKHRAPDRRAYDLYLKGRYHWHRRGLDLPKALEHFKKAIEIDPEYALAHVGLADTFWSLAAYGVRHPGRSMEEGRTALRKAEILAPDLPEIFAARGTLEAYAAQWADSESALRRAIEIDQRNAFAHVYYGFLAGLLQRREEMHLRFRMALELEPLSQYHTSVAAWGSFLSGDLDQALAYSELGLELAPSSFLSGFIHAGCLMESGDLEGALREYGRLVEVSGRPAVALGTMGYCLGRAGRMEEARAIMAELRELSATGYVNPMLIGYVHAGLGETAQARACYEAAIGDGPMPHLLIGCQRQFPDLLESLGLPPVP